MRSARGEVQRNHDGKGLETNGSGSARGMSKGVRKTA
jgi:hypothetical protein